MLFRAFAAATLLLVPGSANPQTTIASPVVQVICPTSPFTAITGTAFKVARNLVVSVTHVTRNTNCFVKGKPVKAWQHPKLDFSLIEMDVPGKALQIDCGGFVKGRKYRAIGYARGAPFETSVDLVGTGMSSGQYSVLVGIFTVVPGMSGGPIVDVETGKVVGTVNVSIFDKGLSGSVALKNTSLCQRA